MNEENHNYKWTILILVVLTNMFVIAIPMMGMSVLSREIADDLNFSVVQVGIIWGVSALPGIVASLFGGAIGDRIGPKRVLVTGVLLGGLLGASRGLANSFLSMTIITLLMGTVLPLVLMNGIKVLGQWFPAHQLGLANGAQAMSMALGFMLGSLFSATTFSPWLGGWRNVLMAYGLIGAALSIPWAFTRTKSTQSAAGETPSIGKAIRHVTGLKNIWLLGLGLFGISGAVQGTLGFLPLYLRGMGWQPLQADGALTAFHTISMILVMPISLFSDRMRSRKPLLLIASLMIASGVGLLSFVSGSAIWVSVLLAGSVRDAFMAIFQTMTVETEKVGPLYAGTAVGFTMSLTSIGNLVAPPLGNSLAALWLGAPFAFWSLLAVFGSVCLVFVKAKVRQKPGR